MANVLKHRFSSGKADGPDATQVQPSNWNDGHIFSGGNAGDMLTRDPTDASFGAKWAAPPVIPPGTYVATLTAGGPASVPSDRSRYFLLLSSASAVSIDGVAPATGTFADGTRLDILNVGSATWLLLCNSTGIASGRFLNHVASKFATQLAPADAAGGGFASYVWNAGYWRMASHEQCGPLTLGLSNANFTGFTAATINLQVFYLRGREAHVQFYAAINVPASVASLRITGWPCGFPATSPVLPLMTYGAPTHTPSTWGPDFCITTATPSIDMYLSNSGAWPAGAYSVSIDAVLAVV